MNQYNSDVSLDWSNIPTKTNEWFKRSADVLLEMMTDKPPNSQQYHNIQEIRKSVQRLLG